MLKMLYSRFDDSLIRRGDPVLTPDGLGILKYAHEPKREGHIGLVVVELQGAKYSFSPETVGLEWRNVENKELP